MLSMLRARRLELPVRRVLAIDAGSRSLKLMLVESAFSRWRILRQDVLDLSEEGLLSAGELGAHLQRTIEAWGRPPVALTLPQHLSTSQLIDLPPVPNSEAGRLIAEEVQKHSGLSESAIIYDSTRIESLLPSRQQFWVTLCREGDTREQIKRLGLQGEDICEVTTTANALLAAFHVASPNTRRAALVHAGAQSTVVVLVLGGHGVFASSFPVGGDAFTRALGEQLKCPVETAEDLKRAHDFFAGPDAAPGLQATVAAWLTELKRQLHDWFSAHRQLAAEVADLEVFVSGGVFAQAGLVGHLNAAGGLHFRPWPPAADVTPPALQPGFEVALGTALQALGRSPQPASLLPPGARAAWQRRAWRQLIELASAGLLVLIALLLIAATAQKLRVIHQKMDLLNKARVGLGQARTNALLAGQLLAQYEQIRPVLDRQQQAFATRTTLDLLQQARSNRSLWFVLFADQQSYFTQPLPALSTNQPGATNLLLPLRYPSLIVSNLFGPVLTNPSPAKPGFITELCIPEEPEAARRTLSQLVNDLKQDPIFAKVDSLSDDLRRPLADPKVLLSDRHFALSLELADTELQRPSPPRRRLPALTNAPPRASPRLSKSVSGAADTPNPMTSP
jgi:Tfp pilus assembly PilM family ATPase